jgi:hypothetical protein
MHVSLARLAAGCVAATTLAALAGCAATPAARRPAGHTGTSRALYLLVGVHRNEPRPGIPQAVAPLLETAVRHAEPITVIAVDGEPRIVYSSAPYTISTSSDSAANDDVATETNAVLAAVTHATARVDGDNLAKAVSVAADHAASIGVRHPTDVVIDSGASDRGAVVMTTPGMTSAVPSEVAGFVSTAGTLRRGRLRVHQRPAGTAVSSAATDHQGDLAERARATGRHGDRAPCAPHRSRTNYPLHHWDDRGRPVARLPACGRRHDGVRSAVASWLRARHRVLR